MDELQLGIEAAEAGDKKIARKHFRKFLSENLDHELGWLWLSRVVENEEDKKRCLARVLMLNPYNEEALEVLGGDAEIPELQSNEPEQYVQFLMKENPPVIVGIPPPEPSRINREFILVLLQGWWIVALLTMGGIFVALFLSYTETPIYRTTARYLITPPGSIESSRDFTDNVDSQADLMATFAELFQSQALINAAFNRINVAPTNRITTRTVVLPDTSILQTITSGPSPEAISVFTNAIGIEASIFIKSYYPFYEFTVLDEAQVPNTPISPNIPRNLVATTFVSFIVGVFIAVIRTQIIMVIRGNREAELNAQMA